MENAKRAQQRLKDKGYPVKADGDFGGKSFAALMSFVGGRPDVSQLRTDLGTAAAVHFKTAGIITPLRIAHALAQQSVETGGFTKMVESLNYSVAGLRATFSKARISDADCEKLGRKAGEGPLNAERQQAIANLVYGGAWGKANLGNTQPDDGWTYRGRGAKQTTGRTNYGAIKSATGLDVIANPELLANPDTGMKAACLFWTSRKCNAIADKDDIKALTLAVNGGTNGLAEREAALKRAKEILL